MSGILFQLQCIYLKMVLDYCEANEINATISCSFQRNETGDYLYGNNTVPAARSINSNTVTPHEYTIEGLHANGSYLIKLYGRNEFGNSEEVDFEFFTPSGECNAMA